MIVIVCLDDAGGMMFNHRRQSKDRIVNQDILQMCEGKRLWMNVYSTKLFEESAAEIVCDEEYLTKAGEGEYCFVEDLAVHSYENQIERIVIYKWNRRYPTDQYFDLDLDGWTIVYAEEFSGYSHEKITKEIYEKVDKIEETVPVETQK